MVSLENIAYGSAIGLALGLTGGGGSIVTLPILVYLVGEAVHPAIATSLAIVGAISAQGAFAQRSVVRWRMGAVLGACGLLGAVPGALLSKHVPGNILLMLFAGTMLVAATAMYRSRGNSSAATASSKPILVIGSGFGLGFLTGFLGVGGGFLIVPVLVFVLGLSMRDAIATSLFVIALNSASGLATHAFDGSVDWSVVALFVIGGIAGNIVGLAIGERLAQRQLKAIFATLVMGVGLYTGANASGLLSFHVK
ncbi:MAG: sulfite exporter TauE/SafE family protein [Candidatus Velthaea sp.]